MDAIIMPSIRSLLARLKIDYPRLRFIKGDEFLWSHSDNAIYYLAYEQAEAYLLHELSHYLLGHSDFKWDVELLAMERKAWEEAKLLAQQYDVNISEDFIQSNLDTYRDWLHARSTCPNCQANGLQIDEKMFHCIACNHDWKVNEARTCSLRRYDLSKSKKRT